MFATDRWHAVPHLAKLPGKPGGQGAFHKSGRAFDPPGQPPRRSYRLCDVMQGAEPGHRATSTSEFQAMSKAAKSGVPSAERDNLNFNDPRLPPALRAAIVDYVLRASNGMRTLNDPTLRRIQDELTELVEAGTIGMDVAGSMLRLLSGASAGTWDGRGSVIPNSEATQGGSDAPYYYDPTGPAGSGGGSGGTAYADRIIDGLRRIARGA